MSDGRRRDRRLPGRLRPWTLLVTTGLVAAAVAVPVAPAASFGETRIERISERPDGATANGNSTLPVVAADRPDVLAFVSTATDLVAGDPNLVADIFLNTGGVVRRITGEFDGSHGGASQPTISAAGRFVAYVLDEDERDQIYVTDVTAPPPSTPVPDVSDGSDQSDPALSPDGRFLAWAEGDQVWVWEWSAPGAEPELVSVGPEDDDFGGCCSRRPSVADGAAAVAFESTAALVATDLNANGDVYVRRGPFTPAPTTTLVSRPAPGLLGNGPSAWPSIRRDGSEVAFHSFATNLVHGDDNLQPDVFLAGPGGVLRLTSGAGASLSPSVSGDARYVAFQAGPTGASAPAVPGTFEVVLQSGETVSATGVVGMDGPSITLAFPPGTVAAAVGAAVAEGALIDYQVVPLEARQGRSNANPLDTDNRGPATTAPPAEGRLYTDRPDLVSVASNVGSDVATFCFDQPITAGTGELRMVDLNTDITLEPVDAGLSFLGGSEANCVDAEFPDPVSTFRRGIAEPGSVRSLPGLSGNTPGAVDVLETPIIVDLGTVDVVGEGGGFPAESLLSPGKGALTGGTGITTAAVALDASIPCLPPPGPLTKEFAGRTSAPDVVTRTRASGVDVGVYDFVVDEPLVFGPLAGDFGYYDTAGAIRRGVSLAANPGCNGQSFSVTMEPPSDPDAIPERFFVDELAFRDPTFETSLPLTTGGTTSRPDLVSVTLVGTDPPTYAFEFDDTVTDVDVPSFRLHPVDGHTFEADSAAVDPPGSDTVLATFPELGGFTDQVVVATVLAGAVREISGTTVLSTPGSLVVDQPVTPPGPTDGPDLADVAYDTAANTVTYVFDENVRDAMLYGAGAEAGGPFRVVVLDRVTNRTLPGVIEPLPVVPTTEGRPSLASSGRYVAFDAGFPAPVPGAGVPAVGTRNDAFRADLLFAGIEPAALDFGEFLVGVSSTPLGALLRNTGFGPLVAGAVSVVGSTAFAVVANGCTGVPVMTDLTCPMTVTFTPTGEGDATATLTVPDNALGSPRTVELRGRGRVETTIVTVPEEITTVPTTTTPPPTPPPPTFTPTLTLNPAIGPPGTVTEVAGAGFPPGATVVLEWSGGLGALPTASVVAGPDGSFRDVPMLVFHRDQLGTRRVQASVVDHADLRPSTAFLVVPSQVDAPGFVVRR